MSVRWMVNPIVGLICDWLIPRTIINSEVRARNSAVRFTLKNRHHQPGLSGPESANRVTLTARRELLLFSDQRTSPTGCVRSEKCHVWTAPVWQELSSRFCSIGRCSHVFGLLMRCT
jgi:hypothetical protein